MRVARVIPCLDVTGGRPGTGLQLSNATGSATFNGTTTVNKSGAGAGVFLQDVAGTLTFQGLAITTANGAGFTASSAAPPGTGASTMPVVSVSATHSMSATGTGSSLALAS